nr:EIICB-Glc [Klebsiella pneumoniae]
MPIATGFFCLILAAIFGYVWPPVQHAIHSGGEWIVSAGALGSGIFGFINRLLIPTGLHQVLNTIAGSRLVSSLTPLALCSTATSTASTPATAPRDVHVRLLPNHDVWSAGCGAGDVSGGAESASSDGRRYAAVRGHHRVPDRGNRAAGIPVHVPAPLLYLLHAVLTGISLFIATALGIHAGFSFSAGAIDYVLMYSLPAASKTSGCCW